MIIFVIMKVYVDTSVFGGYFDKEFKKWSVAFFDEVDLGIHKIVSSALVEQELKGAPENVKGLYERNKKNIQEVIVDDSMIKLAEHYIEEEVISKKYFNDGLHIAIASIYKIDVLVSWNFKHIVNLNRIRLFNAVNLKNGYLPIEIRSPREILKE